MKKKGQKLDQGKIARLLVSKWCGVAYGLLGFIVGGIESRETAEATVRKAYPNGIKVLEVDDNGECDEDGELIAFDENGDPI